MKITCSKCESLWPIPIEDGVESFPRHYILQHKQVLARLNQDPNWKILCDICTQEKPVCINYKYILIKYNFGRNGTVFSYQICKIFILEEGCEKSFFSQDILTKLSFSSVYR